MIAVASGGHASRFPTVYSQPPTHIFKGMPYDIADRRMSSANEGLYAPTSLLLRKLPLNTTTEALRTMLLFAKDLQDTEIIPSEHEEDQGFATGIARFSSVNGASEAQAMLDGKPNTAGVANMIVEIAPLHTFSAGFRRNTIDPASSRPVPQATSPIGRSSRYNNSFDPISKLSPPPTTSPPESSLSESSGPFPTMFHPQSPRGSHQHDRTRISGKSVIGEEAGDDETDGLLRDPVGYMKKDSSMSNSRRPNDFRVPLRDFSALSLNTSMSTAGPTPFHTPRSALPMHSPHTPFSPGGGAFVSGNPYLRHNYPPVNPADQNPPCNTLYVGNLPMDTSEDELKAMFSKQRGYKRLCFRTKQNGPMCFVEFEDISFATKALNELYGAQLHNSVKGGIRLSFSKNPLGVRSGQPGSSTGPPTPLNPSGPNLMNGVSAMSPGGFSTASGPPPGLSAPPGFPPNSNGMSSQYAGLGMRSPPAGPGSDGGMGNLYPDYMMGR